MKVIFLYLCTFGLLWAQQGREGNFDIRIEPTAKLQTGVQVPFAITVEDARHKPLPNAKVTLQIAKQNGSDVQIFRASGTEPGNYIAKPIFPNADEWDVYVEVQRDGMRSARTIQFQVAP